MSDFRQADSCFNGFHLQVLTKRCVLLGRLLVITVAGICKNREEGSSRAQPCSNVCVSVPSLLSNPLNFLVYEKLDLSLLDSHCAVNNEAKDIISVFLFFFLSKPLMSIVLSEPHFMSTHVKR